MTAWANRAGRTALVLAGVGWALAGLGAAAVVGFCSLGLGDIVIVPMLLAPLAPLLLLVAFVLGIAGVGKSTDRWQPVLAIVLAVVGVLPSLLALVPAFTVALGGTLSCGDDPGDRRGGPPH